MALFLLDRVAVLASVGHLFTDVNPAEYGFLSVVADHLDVPVGEALADPHARGDLLHAFRLVGNQMHGTLGALGVVLLAVAQWTDVVLGTPLLRTVALVQSGLTVALWLVALRAATGSRWVLVAFTVLAILGPPVWMGLNLLCWGTHETVQLVQAALVALALPWIALPLAAGPQQGRTLLVGTLSGLAVLLNPALALPAVSAVVGVALASFGARPSWGSLARGLAGLAGAALLGIGVLQAILATGWLDGLGYPRGLPLDRLTGLIGKNGAPLLHARSGDALELARWEAEAWAHAFEQAPTVAYGARAVVAERLARGGVLGAGALGAVALSRAAHARWGTGRRVAGWVGLHLLAGLAATLWLTRHMGLDPTVPTGAPPRYFAHLYPFGFAAVALALGMPGAALRRALGMGVALWVAWVGAFEHVRSIDVARLSPQEARVSLRYDGAAAWFTDRPSSVPPPDRLPFPAESDDFRRGYAAITGLQSARYWTWTRPTDLARDRERVAHAFVRGLRPSTEVADPRAYWRGVGAALRVAVPQSRVPHAALFWNQQGRWAEVVRIGYDAPP